MSKSKTLGFIVVAVASGLLLTNGSAFAACDATSIGATTGNSEKDTVGYACVDQGSDRAGGDIAPSQRSIVQIGPATGNPETDTFGYTQTPVK